MELTQFKALTFDVIGTLINYEQGLLDWLHPRLKSAGKDMADVAVLECFASSEAYRQRLASEVPFVTMLPQIWEDVSRTLGIPFDAEDAATFPQSVSVWPAFPDAVEALAYLRQHFHLVAVTNGGRMATDVFAHTLGEPFHKTITVEDMGFTKPHPQAFAYVEQYLKDQGFGRPQWLHVAQSQFHDIMPGKALGLNTAWIERRHGEQGYGASPVPAEKAVPDFHFHSLAGLAEAHRKALNP